MKNTILISALLLSSLQTFTLNAQAEVVGGVVVGVTVDEVIALANGWSAKKSILGKPVYNDKGDKIGIVDDLIIAPNKSLSYAIIGAGGFLGMGKYDVAIPVTKINEVNGKMELKGATKESIKQMPEFVYATNTANRNAFIANAEQDIQKGKDKLAELNKKANTEKADMKAKIDSEIVELKQQINNAETKLTELKNATEKKWRSYESGVTAAVASVRKHYS
ncbi:MAG: PRC-barrel domain-containing protein [Bdellovibrio sp.]|nr:PRC-barrel domain-containing protein [Methylotenera sp.]